MTPRALALALPLVLTACANKQPVEASTVTTATSDGEYVTFTTTRVFVDPPLAEACGLADNEIRFETNSANIYAMDRSTLRKIARCMDHPEMQDEKLRVIGHTDPRGSDSYNDALGRSRAVSVEHYLTTHAGMSKDRVDTMSLGELAASERPAEWPSDRKVELRLDDRIDVVKEVEVYEVEDGDESG